MRVGGQERAVQRPASPESLVRVEEPNPRVARGVLGDELGRAVGRPVLCDHELEPVRACLEDLERDRDRLLERGAVVVDREHRGQFGLTHEERLSPTAIATSSPATIEPSIDRSG